MVDSIEEAAVAFLPFSWNYYLNNGLQEEAESFINEYKEYQRKTCFQKGKYININWSKLTKEQKIDRIKSYIHLNFHLMYCKFGIISTFVGSHT